MIIYTVVDCDNNAVSFKERKDAEREIIERTKQIDWDSVKDFNDEEILDHGLTFFFSIIDSELK